MFNSLLDSLNPVQPASTIKKKRHRRKKSKSLQGAIVSNENEDCLDNSVDGDEDVSLESLVKNMKMGGKNESFSEMTSLKKTQVVHEKRQTSVPPPSCSTLLPPSPQAHQPSVLTPQEFYAMCVHSFRATCQPPAETTAGSVAYVCAGLVNTGNTCFINCILQSILSVELFASLLASLLQCQAPPSLPAWKEFLSFCHAALTEGGRERGAVAPSEFMRSLVREFGERQGKEQESSSVPRDSSRPTLDLLLANTHTHTHTHLSSSSSSSSSSGDGNGLQSDAMEFFTFLLDSLHEELRGNCNSADCICDSATDGDTGIDARAEEWAEVGRGKTKVSIDDNQSRRVAADIIQSSVISQTFHGSFRSTVKYAAKKTTSITYQRFHSLQLEVGRRPLNLTDALKCYFMEEVITHDRSSRVTKSLAIEHPPRVLVLHLKRFQFDQRRHHPVKVQSEVSFPPLLTIPESCLSGDLIERLHLSAQKKERPTQSQAEATSAPQATSLQQGDGSLDPSASATGVTKGPSRKARRRMNAANKNNIEARTAATGKHIPGMPAGDVLPPDDTVSSNRSSGGEIRYTLQSVVLHHGVSTMSGHYTCLARRAGGEWVHIDDVSVSPVTEEFVLHGMQSQVYILFYALLVD